MLSVFFAAALLLASDGDACRVYNQQQDESLEVSLEEFQDQSLDILYALEELGNTDYVQEDITELTNVDDARQLFYELDALHTQVLKPHKKPKKKVHWSTETDAQTCVYEPESFNLGQSNHYNITPGNDSDGQTYFWTNSELQQGMKEGKERQKEEMKALYQRWTAGMSDDV